jgi:hypothetical protein
MLKKLIFIFLLSVIQQNLLFGGGCPFYSRYKINGGISSQGTFSGSRIYSIPLQSSDTVYMHAEDECSLQHQWFYNGVPIAGAIGSDLKTDSAGTYSLSNSYSSYVQFVVTNVVSCPVINAGPDQTHCNTVSNIVLNGSRSYLSDVLWTGGSGSFIIASTPDAIYRPSSADIALGMVKLCLRSSGSCASVSDSVTIILTEPISVKAGDDQTICNTDNIVLNGMIGVGTVGGVWTTTGTGTFAPDNTDLNATYIPSSSDTALGTVSLCLKSNGSCVSERDSINIILSKPISVKAGNDQIVCKTENVILNGIVGVGAGGIWSSTGNGIFTPNNTDLNATYIPSISDQISGAVTFTLMITGNGNCAETDHIGVTFITCLSTSTKKTISAEGIHVYPNPVEGIITVDFSEVKGIISLDVLNVLGVKLRTYKVEETKGQMSLDLEDLGPGIYFVSLQNDQGQQLIKKMVKE